MELQPNTDTSSEMQWRLSLSRDGVEYEWKFEDLFQASNTKQARDVPVEDLGVLDTDIWFNGPESKPTLRNIAEKIIEIE